jgi:ParB family transcriptional regulator, chromosome partitioning protein
MGQLDELAAGRWHFVAGLFYAQFRFLDAFSSPEEVLSMLEYFLTTSMSLLPFLILLGVVASAGQTSQTLRKPITWIKPEKQIRTDYGTDAEQRLFGESVKTCQLQALVCLNDGTLVCGYRRFHCGVLVGMTEFDVTILPDQLSSSQIKCYRLTENIQRKDLNAWEMWQSCAELLTMNSTWQMRDLAAHLHFDPSSITRYLSPSKCIEAAQNALREGRIGISDCYEFSQETPEVQTKLLDLKLTGASRSVIRATRKSKSEEAESIRMSRVKIAMPHGATMVINGIDLSMSDVVELLTETLKEARKAAEQYDVKTFQSMMKDKSKVKG